METTTHRLLVPYDEARKQLGGIGRTKFYDLIDQKQIVRVCIGRRGFITADSLEAFVQGLSDAAIADDNPVAATTTPLVAPTALRGP